MPKVNNETLEIAASAGETLIEKALLSIAVSLKRMADSLTAEDEEQSFPSFGNWPQYDQEADGNGADAQL